ncbi:MAG: hemolysin family protein, partial [Ilumatobacteraceae bacterium]
REVMVPRPDMVIVANEATVTDALNLGIAHGFSRLPVFGDDETDIAGIAFTKDLIRAEREGRGDLPVLDLIRPVVFIPENKPVARLMREMQASKFHLAIVADEYGDIAGVITLEDCLEELVGEIVDEYDTDRADIEELPTGELIVAGKTNIDDLNDRLSVDLPNEDFDSVGGFIFSSLERVPEPGDVVEFEGHRFITELVEGRRVRRVRVEVPAGVVADTDESGEDADGSD